MITRVIFDTNILLDFFLFEDATTLPILDALTNGFIKTYVTEPTLYELADVLKRRQFNLTEAEVSNILNRWRSLSMLVAPPAITDILCKDPDDQKFIDLAIHVNAHYLISKDKLVLRCKNKAKKQHNLLITQPQNFRLIKE